MGGLCHGMAAGMVFCMKELSWGDYCTGRQDGSFLSAKQLSQGNYCTAGRDESVLGAKQLSQGFEVQSNCRGGMRQRNGDRKIFRLL